jgi:hypothetical protein
MMRMAALAVLLATALAVSSDAAPQRRGQRGFGRYFGEIRSATPESYDGSFQFCRVMFDRSLDGDGAAWWVDYPRADINLSIRLSELTRTRISEDPSREPNHVVIRLTDDYLFQCPFIMMTEVGAIHLDNDEATKLREYLLKGGFLWADDFWGTYAWDIWAREIGKALPSSQYPIIDLPPSHPIFRTQFQSHLIQIPSINAWMALGGGTSERGEDSAEPHARAILDRDGRVMVFITHNTDYGDAFEREGDDHTYFQRFSVDGYALGIDVLLYALSH